MKTQKKTFKFKILIPPAAVIIAVVVIISVFLSLRLSRTGDSLINEKLFAITNSLELHFENSEANTRAAAVSMARDNKVAAAIMESDTDGLLRILAPTLDLYRVTFYVVTDIEGNVLARTHEPGSFGDSLIGMQNVKDALAGKVSTYYEEGVLVKVSVCTGAPVYDDNGAIIGAILAGVRFDLDSEAEKLKKLFGSEVTVFLGDTRIVTTITMDGRSIVGTTLDPRIAEIVIDGKREYFGDAEILGAKYKTFYKPLLNAKNEAFAAIFLGFPLSELIEETNRSIRDGVFLGVGGLIISLTLLYFIISSISQPITKLSNQMHHIANGNLSIDVIIKGNDEVGALGMSLKRVADTLHKLIDDIDMMIVEHKKGNTDYHLDTKEFFGDYKTLADNILELAAFSMKDQLTNMPNRRSFDNRLELEWERAIRKQQHISILMIDIDKFKNYNDKFGHQQGDVTLQTVAGAIKQSLNRSIDFAARWGGEEFAVLLPETDAPGAFHVAERIRKAVEDTVIPCDNEQGRKATISIGVDTMLPTFGSGVEGFIAAADNALYKSKKTGRNKVTAYQDDDDPTSGDLH